jgi:uncharacterized protein (DUF1697 family)
MTAMIALLRGVNVGGVTIKSVDLAAVFTGLGYADVKTVLASGNVAFGSDSSTTALTKEIQAALGDRFGYDARVHVLQADELQRIVDAFPFDENRDGWHPYVIFLMTDEPREPLLALDLDREREELRPGKGVLYWTVERGHTLDSVIGKETGRAKWKALTTTRNLRTLRKLMPR